MLVLAGCAIGNKYDYGAAIATIYAETDKSVSATVIDQRPYVLSGSKSPSFVGLQRGGFGNPFDVKTKSGRGLAEDLTDVLVRALDAQGIAKEVLLAQQEAFGKRTFINARIFVGSRPKTVSGDSPPSLFSFVHTHPNVPVGRCCNTTSHSPGPEAGAAGDRI